MKKDNNLSIKKPQQMLLSTLEGTTLGVWISHGEGKFKLPNAESEVSPWLEAFVNARKWIENK